MAKVKVSQWDSTAANNTDINSININEGCPPSTINNAIREVMAQIKDWQDGSSGDNWTSSGVLNVTGSLTLDGSQGNLGQVLMSSGSSATPFWGDAFVTGMIMLWSGSTSSVPSGWALCNGSSGTPDLRNRFVVGAGSTYAVNATGGSADAVVVTHTHPLSGNTGSAGAQTLTASTSVSGTTTAAGAHNHYVTQSNTSSSTFANNEQTFTWASAGGLGNSDYRGGARNERANRGRSSDVGNHSHGLSISASTSVSAVPNHVHTLSGNTGGASSGVSGTNKNLPPYYALAYIMKL